MRTKSLRFTAAIIAAVVLAVTLFAGCSSKDEGRQERDPGKVVAGIVSPLPSDGSQGEHYQQNMELFRDTLNNIFTYECIYYYYQTADHSSAYREAVEMKTKLLYAIQQDYFLSEEEQNAVYANADEYLRMQYDDIGFEGAYDPDTVVKKFYGISFDQYKKIRLCESLIDKCSSDLFRKMGQDGSISRDEIKKVYDENPESYDFVLLRYISYKLNPGGDSAGNAAKEAAAQKLCSKLNSVAEMLQMIGGESDRQSEGNSNGQMTVHMDDTDHLFYEFIKNEGGTAVNAKKVAYDQQNVYVVMCEGYFTWENSTAVYEAVKDQYITRAAERTMLQNALQYTEPEGWDTMTNLEEIQAAKFRGSYTNVIPKLKIASQATTIFLTIQDPGDTTSCRFYAYEKTDGIWSETFQTAGYVGRSGIADTKNRVEGDGTSPAGVYSFGMLFGIFDDPGGLKKSYLKVDNEDYWDGDNNSDTYNQHVRASDMPADWDAGASEHLINYKYSYNYAVMVNYNVNPTVKGKGSAIFLHCTYPGSLASAGCISIPQTKLLRALRMIDDNAYIVLARNAEDLAAYC